MSQMTPAYERYKTMDTKPDESYYLNELLNPDEKIIHTSQAETWISDCRIIVTTNFGRMFIKQGSNKWRLLQ